MIKFLFSWTKQQELFNPNQHVANDVNIIDLQIEHDEGKKARAILTILEQNIDDITDKYGCWISYEFDNGEQKVIYPIFSGKFSKIHSIEIYDLQYKKVTLEFSAFVLNSDQMTNMNSEKYEIEKNLVEFDRINGEALKAHYLYGVSDSQNNIEISSNNVICSELVKYIHQRTPSKINLDITAEWTQEYIVQVNLFQKIYDAFNGQIETFTPKSITHFWPDKGEFIGNGDYYISQSKIEKTQSNTHFYHNPNGDDNSTITAISTRFNGELTALKHVTHKRKEVLHLEMSYDVEENFEKFTDEKFFKIALGNVAQKYQDWESEKMYYKNDVVIFNKREFTCIKDHSSSNNFTADNENWSPQTWKINSEYKIYDVVEINHKRYTCLKDHKSHNENELTDTTIWQEHLSTTDQFISISSNSFFGEKPDDYDHAIDMSANYLYKNSRILLYKFKIIIPNNTEFAQNFSHYKKILSASPINTISFNIEEMRNKIQENNISGKIVNYKIHVNNSQKYVEFVVAKSIIKNQNTDISDNNKNKKSSIYGIKYQTPEINLIQPERENILCFVEVTNNYQQQKNHIESNLPVMFQTKSKEILKEISTKVKIKFAKLNNKKLESYIKLSPIKIGK